MADGGCLCDPFCLNREAPLPVVRAEVNQFMLHRLRFDHVSEELNISGSQNVHDLRQQDTAALHVSSSSDPSAAYPLVPFKRIDIISDRQQLVMIDIT